MMLVPEGAKAGKISKPYGHKGELTIVLVPDTGKHIEPDTPLFIDIDGQRVPFFIEEVELVSDNHAIIKFEYIDSLETAKALTGCDLYLDHNQFPVSADKGEDLANLIGFVASDRVAGHLGRITDFLPHPMNPVFVILTEKDELMVPATRDFINHIDFKGKTIQFILPEGLTSL